MQLCVYYLLIVHLHESKMEINLILLDSLESLQ